MAYHKAAKPRRDIKAEKAVELLVSLCMREVVNDPFVSIAVEDKRVYVRTESAVSLKQLNQLKKLSKARDIHVIGRVDDLIIVFDY